MGRNLKQGAIRQEQQQQRHKLRDHNRETWYVWKDERRFVLRHRAGPGRQGTCLCLPMVTGLMVAPGMKVKTSGGRLFKINETGMTENSCNQADGDQEASYDYCRSRRQTRSSML